jgi:hypothetical protein
MQLGAQYRYAEFNAKEPTGGLAITTRYLDGGEPATFLSHSGGTQPGAFRWLEGSGSGTNYVEFKALATLAGNTSYTLPAADGSSGQVLSTSGAGILSWATAGSGAVGTDAIWDVKGDLAVGTGANTASRLAASTNGFVLSCDSVEATGLKWIAASGGGDMLLGTSQVVTALKTFGAAGAVGKFALAGTTSGSTVVDATAIASGTLTLPAATDTLVGKATTDIFTNKTYDTAGTGNSFSINSVAVTANTGTGAVARAASPTFTTPILGAATATSLNGLTVTTTTGTLTLVNGSTLVTAGAFSNTLTTTGATNVTLPTTGTLATLAGTETLTNKRITPRVVTAADATSITPNTDSADVTYQANTQAAGTLTINADGGTPTNGQKWILKTKTTNAQTFAWNAQFVGSTDLALPTVTTAAKVDYFGFIWEAVASKWNMVAKQQGF